MGERGLGDQFQGGVVVNLLPVQTAAVTVIRVLAEADIGNHRHAGNPVFQLADSLLHNAVAGIGPRPEGVFLFRQAKEDQGTHAAFQAVFGLFHQLVH